MQRWWPDWMAWAVPVVGQQPSAQVSRPCQCAAAEDCAPGRTFGAQQQRVQGTTRPEPYERHAKRCATPTNGDVAAGDQTSAEAYTYSSRLPKDQHLSHHVQRSPFMPVHRRGDLTRAPASARRPCRGHRDRRDRGNAQRQAIGSLASIRPAVCARSKRSRAVRMSAWCSPAQLSSCETGPSSATPSLANAYSTLGGLVA